MATWKKKSKFVNIKSSPAKEYFRDLRLAKPSGSSSQISVNSDGSVLAVPYQSSNSILLLPADVSKFDLKKTQTNPSLLAGHKSAISDIEFSTIDPSILASTGKDGFVNIWKFSGIEDANRDSSLSISIPGNVANRCRLHPLAQSVAIAGGKDAAYLLDLDQGKIVSEFTLGSELTALSWSYDGSSGAALSKNGKLSVFDPRTNRLVIDMNSKLAVPHNLLYLGNEEKIVVYGSDRMKKPRIEIFDPVSPGRPILADPLNGSTGDILGSFDNDSKLLFTTLRGSTIMEAIEMSTTLSTGQLTVAERIMMDSSVQGIASTPKFALDVLNTEVVKIYKLGGSEIIPISVNVPRKTAGFHEDLFSDSLNNEPSMTSVEYFSGKEIIPIFRSLDPVKVEKYFQAKVDPSTVLTEKEEEMLTKEIIEEQKKIEIDQILNAPKSETRQKLETLFKKNTFNNLKGSEPQSLDASWYKLNVGGSMPFGRNIICNAKYLFVPWSTLAGSAIAVFDIDKKGRAPVELPLIRAHTQDISSMDVLPHDPSQLLTGSIDAHIRLWNIPEGGLTKDLTEPSMDVLGIGKISTVKFIPVTRGLFAAASSSFQETSLAIWDTLAQSKRYDIVDHKQPISDFDFSSNASLLASTSRDKLTRIFDVRASVSPIVQFEHLESLRDAGVLWLGNSIHIMTYGFAKGSSRQFSIWDVRMINSKSSVKKPLITQQLDRSNSQLLPYYDDDTGLCFMGSIGDRQIHFYSIDINEDKESTVEKLSTHKCPDLIKGLCFRSKFDLDVKNVEVARAFRLGDEEIREITFNVPRKRKDYFQDDIYVPTRSLEPIYTGDEWLQGIVKEPSKVSLCPSGMQLLSSAPKEELTDFQQRRVEIKKHQAEVERKNYPTMTDHFAGFENVARAAVGHNRWDSKVISTNEVDDDEW